MSTGASSSPCWLSARPTFQTALATVLMSLAQSCANFSQRAFSRSRDGRWRRQIRAGPMEMIVHVGLQAKVQAAVARVHDAEVDARALVAYRPASASSPLDLRQLDLRAWRCIRSCEILTKTLHSPPRR